MFAHCRMHVLKVVFIRCVTKHVFLFLFLFLFSLLIFLTSGPRTDFSRRAEPLHSLELALLRVVCDECLAKVDVALLHPARRLGPVAGPADHMPSPGPLRVISGPEDFL